MIDAELADDTKPVSTAENELNEFAGKPYEPPKAKEGETEKCVESEEFKTKTDVYEVVCDPTGKIYIKPLLCKTILAYIKCLAFSNTISYIQFRKALKTMQDRI